MIWYVAVTHSGEPARRRLLREPAMPHQETLEILPDVLSLVEHRALGTHEGMYLCPPLCAAHIILGLQRLGLLVERAELSGERRVVISEGADLRLLRTLLLHVLRSLCPPRVRLAPVP